MIFIKSSVEENVGLDKLNKCGILLVSDSLIYRIRRKSETDYILASYARDSRCDSDFPQPDDCVAKDNGQNSSC